MPPQFRPRRPKQCPEADAESLESEPTRASLAPTQKPSRNISPSFEQQLGRLAILPREIRDEIYYQFCGGRSTTIMMSWDPRRAILLPRELCALIYPRAGETRETYPKVIFHPSVFSALQVSRRFSEEVAYMLYSSTRFNMEPETLGLFLKRVPESSRNLVTSLRLDLRVWNPTCGNTHKSILGPARALLWMSGLKNLTVAMERCISVDLGWRAEPDAYSIDLRNSPYFPALKTAKIELLDYGRKRKGGEDEHDHVSRTFLDDMRDLLQGTT